MLCARRSQPGRTEKKGREPPAKTSERTNPLRGAPLTRFAMYRSARMRSTGPRNPFRRRQSSPCVREAWRLRPSPVYPRKPGPQAMRVLRPCGFLPWLMISPISQPVSWPVNRMGPLCRRSVAAVYLPSCGSLWSNSKIENGGNSPVRRRPWPFLVLMLLSPGFLHAGFGPRRSPPSPGTENPIYFRELERFPRVTKQKARSSSYGTEGDAEGHILDKVCRTWPASRQKKPGHEAPVVSLDCPGSSSRRSGWNRSGRATPRPLDWVAEAPALPGLLRAMPGSRHPSLEKRPSLASST